jgi:hypothetical protein
MKDSSSESNIVTKVMVGGVLYEVRPELVGLIKETCEAMNSLEKSFIAPATRSYRGLQIETVRIYVEALIQAICIIEKEFAELDEANNSFVNRLHSMLGSDSLEAAAAGTFRDKEEAEDAEGSAGSS